ncbi:glycosyltransferase [Nitrospira lenta]|uniref:Glycosyl transferase, group 1 n=1 Tax=Nitrospira lenta TaxID=1436998 RepID=A0A330L9X8_9BACT|nr:glycosyltransferase [Nitrospira lenta]SPP66143.1 Glycosyl transferase, group 1 [Nitrospira lenta]
MTVGTHRTTVLHLSTSSGPGGAERMISTLAAALNQGQVRVIVGLFRAGWLQTECERFGVRTIVIPIAGVLGLQWFLGYWELIRKERVALIHAHEFSAIMCGWILAKMAGVPLVATVHGKNYFWEKWRRRVAYRLVSRYGSLVAVSADLKRFICDKVGIEEGRVHVIYNGVAAAQPVADEEAHTCKAELAIVGRYPVLGVVGSLYPVKGHRFLVSAMPEIIRRWPRAVLLVIGRGELEASLKAQAEQLGIADNIRFLGMRSDVPRLLSVLDVFVLPSLSEGLSLALLEAMASGQPVVATAVGGNPELVDQGQTGFLVAPEDAGSLAIKLVELLEDPLMMHRFSAQGATRVRELFSLEQMVIQYRALYASLSPGNGEGSHEGV